MHFGNTGIQVWAGIYDNAVIRCFVEYVVFKSCTTVHLHGYLGWVTAHPQVHGQEQVTDFLAPLIWANHGEPLNNHPEIDC